MHYRRGLGGILGFGNSSGDKIGCQGSLSLKIDTFFYWTLRYPFGGKPKTQQRRPLIFVIRMGI